MRQFCSDLGRVSEEPIEGSAPFAKKRLFLSWPRKKWAETQYASKGFPEELKTSLIHLKKAHGVTTNLISREDMSEKPFAILMPENLLRTFSSIEEMRRCLVEDIEKNQFDEWQQRNMTSVFVCTHGKRDLCCAKYGFAVFKEFRDMGVYDVWESTHLAADRFACNIVVLPVGDFYGRVRRKDVPDLLCAIEQNTVVTRLYRGNIFLDGVHQLIDARLKSLGIEASDLTVNFIDDENAVARCLTSDGAELSWRCIRRQFTMFMDCDQLREGKKRSFGRWVVDDDYRPRGL